MSKYHTADVKGCQRAMDIINQHPNKIEKSYHTEGEKDRWDMCWTLNNGIKWEVEGKDRTYVKPTYITTYDSVMYNYEKYFNQMKRLENNPDIRQGYLASYTDGVVFYNLSKLPYEEIREDVALSLMANQESGDYINGKWCKWFDIKTSTVAYGKVKKQLRLVFPLPNEENNLGKILTING